MKEICIVAAIRTKSGLIIRGQRHHDCIYIAMRSGAKRSDIYLAEQGFVTSKNRFVSREEGRKLQDAAGVKSLNRYGYVDGTLFSEDLY